MALVVVLMTKGESDAQSYEHPRRRWLDRLQRLRLHLLLDVGGRVLDRAQVITHFED